MPLLIMLIVVFGLFARHEQSQQAYWDSPEGIAQVQKNRERMAQHFDANGNIK